MELEEQIRYEANRLLENRDQEIRELIKRNEDNEYINNRLQQEYHDLKADYELVFFYWGEFYIVNVFVRIKFCERKSWLRTSFPLSSMIATFGSRKILEHSFLKCFCIMLFQLSNGDRWYYFLSVIRQKDESQNRCYKKTKHAEFSKNRTFLPPWYTHERIRGLEIFTFREICYTLLLHWPLEY